MTVSILHATQSSIADDATQEGNGAIGPQHWNAQHALTVSTLREPVSAATISIATSDIEVGIDTRTTAVTASLPSAAAWAAANPGFELTIVDIQGNAAANPITPSLNGADTFAYGGVTPTINQNFGLLKLRPRGSPAITGWYIRGVN